ncbi:O-antigen ligase family protein [Marinomonas rhizomae]|uniref:O-antigen ligase family protein n=1 Tax=Marinomonas rhizomae TaxID=491948 RepID=UPI0021069600|nr:O-antigen ligase family protein [Marinomonas rhizomae]UTW00177.1 O-antigen ligase family protein [Marinomonas rhizomae]
MCYKAFSKFVWLTVAASFAVSISIYDGYRYASLFLCVLTIGLLFLKVEKKHFSKTDVIIFFAFLFYGFSLLVFDYIDDKTLFNPRLPLRFIIVLPVMLLLFNVKNYSYYIWYGVFFGAITAFLWALYEVIFLGHYKASNGLISIVFGDIGVLLTMLSLISFVYFYKQRRYLGVVFSLFAVLCGIGASVLSGSRGSWLALPFIVLFLFWQFRNVIKIKFYACLLTVIILAVFTFVFSPQTEVKNRIFLGVNQTLDYMVKGEQRGSSVGLRFEMWKLAIYMFQEKPYFGAGRHSSSGIKKELVASGKIVPQAIKFTHSHNVFFDALGYRGGVGLLLQLMIYIIPLMLFLRKMKVHKDNWDIKIYALAGSIIPMCYMLFGLTEVMFVHKIGVTMYAFPIIYFWVAVRLAEIEKDKESKSPSCTAS